MPASMDPTIQLRFSNLGDAYKKNELIADSELGIYYLSSIPSDLAMPNEGLRANVVWNTGLDGATTLLSSLQIENFRQGGEVVGESDIRGTRGAYLRCKKFTLGAGESLDWQFIADLNLDQTDVVRLNELLKQSDLKPRIKKDADRCHEELKKLVASSDGLQFGAEERKTNRHLSNVLFNIMRGGIPINGYRFKKSDFAVHCRNSNRETFNKHASFLELLPETIHLSDLSEAIVALGDENLTRICLEFLPLTFSRRHGDPTRPWNEFSINVTGPDGERQINYQGNWRDIFQNWEALSVSYPELSSSMIFRFLNASTADGYNPYRITNEGFDWEKISPDDPWSNIGYWGDHQIVYLLRLLTKARQFSPAKLNHWLTRKCFAFANVPYRIKSFQQILETPRETIEFDEQLNLEIEERVKKNGADGKLLQNEDQSVCHLTMLEKLLIPALVKVSNLVPEGGIWLNTQRPEWNDANNAIVGAGLSVVTACDLRKYFVFLRDWIDSLLADDAAGPKQFEISSQIENFLRQQHATLNAHANLLTTGFSDQTRREIVNALSQAGSDYRQSVYQTGISNESSVVATDELVAYFNTCIDFLDQTILSNEKEDGLFHSYNLVEFGDETARVNRLFEMLEGQVAALNSGLLGADQAANLLDALRSSKMYRADQSSYMLYPDRDLPAFLGKNKISPEQTSRTRLIEALLSDGDESIIRKDVNGELHFNGDIRNSLVLNECIDRIASEGRHVELIATERIELVRVFEETFDHATFAGRSGTFFAYEGLGSIYWHMVSKLRLIVGEYLAAAIATSENESKIVARLREHYDQISYGIGATKTPMEYGAIPTDPYSHTPVHQGAQQPGMTGQVKEDILNRLTEVGIRITSGTVSFDPRMLGQSEFVTADAEFNYLDVEGVWQAVQLHPNQFAFTVCQVPVVYTLADEVSFTIQTESNESTQKLDDIAMVSLNEEESQKLFARTHEIRRIDLRFPKTILKQQHSEKTRR